jgi:hypothetical protein
MESVSEDDLVNLFMISLDELEHLLLLIKHLDEFVRLFVADLEGELVIIEINFLPL